VSSGPDLRVYLAPGDGTDTKHALELGKLEGNKGDLQYDIPPNTDVRALPTVLIRSGFLTLTFAKAPLEDR
jgi:hypothetical protein